MNNQQDIAKSIDLDQVPPKTFYDQENDDAVSSFNYFPFQNPQNQQNESDIQDYSDLFMYTAEIENILNLSMKIMAKLISMNFIQTLLKQINHITS